MPETGSAPESPEALVPTCLPWETSGQAPTGALPKDSADLQLQFLEVQSFIPGFGCPNLPVPVTPSVELTGAVAHGYHMRAAYQYSSDHTHDNTGHATPVPPLTQDTCQSTAFTRAYVAKRSL